MAWASAIQGSEKKWGWRAADAGEGHPALNGGSACVQSPGLKCGL